MKKALTAPVQLWHLLLVCVLVAVLTGTAVVSAAPFAPTFLAPGTVRMALASASDASAINVVKGAPSVYVLKQVITIPTGKVADLAALGEVDIEGAGSGYQYCYGQYRLDGVLSGTEFKPGNYILEGFNPPANNLSVPINGYLTNVHAGTHTVYMVMGASFNDCYVQWRSMILFANIH